jgi:hypothetical protein
MVRPTTRECCLLIWLSAYSQNIVSAYMLISEKSVCLQLEKAVYFKLVKHLFLLRNVIFKTEINGYLHTTRKDCQHRIRKTVCIKWEKTICIQSEKTIRIESEKTVRIQSEKTICIQSEKTVCTRKDKTVFFIPNVCLPSGKTFWKSVLKWERDSRPSGHSIRNLDTASHSGILAQQSSTFRSTIGTLNSYGSIRKLELESATSRFSNWKYNIPHSVQ